MQVSLTQNSLDEYLSIIKSKHIFNQLSCWKCISESMSNIKYPPSKAISLQSYFPYY